MKKVFFIALILIAFISCKEDSELLKGEFILYEDASVLQTDSVIYGVIINKKAHELNKLAEQYKKEPTDMVQVEIRGEITPKPENEEGWPFRVEIKEILNISKPKSQDNVVKLGE